MYACGHATPPLEPSNDQCTHAATLRLLTYNDACNIVSPNFVAPLNSKLHSNLQRALALPSMYVTVAEYVR